MNKATIIFTGVILMTIACLNASAQATSSADEADGTATIIAYMTLTNTQGLAFGNIAASTTPGTVYISTTGARTSTGGVTPSAIGTFNHAIYNATGNPNATFDIILPSTAIVTNGTNNMYVNGFTSNPIAVGIFNGSGAGIINVGATLNVNASQPMGNYSGTYNVTISYN